MQTLSDVWVAKTSETERFLEELKTRRYIKEGVVFRRRSVASLECLGTFFEVYSEVKEK